MELRGADHDEAKPNCQVEAGHSGLAGLAIPLAGPEAPKTGCLGWALRPQRSSSASWLRRSMLIPRSWRA